MGKSGKSFDVKAEDESTFVTYATYVHNVGGLSFDMKVSGSQTPMRNI